ncbi:type II secretion system major pseudopilin GspG [Parendozoicomonas haliclonae]|uniref:Type II secretion system core protein G n=1 Tax=Parendozoicomonas haliclonae TaxID=1960125 RepID=A0A1X7AGH8_9GAMM|nr:type II secretion system major pseudopilin GspG [Parendozoicomonas haliclonae]SMA40002.1 Type II secretion system protein G precursor [Parendozoicomonas haliclonae]
MNNSKKRLRRLSGGKQNGFTLLEIMVVIVILGVLASMVVPNVIGNKDTADEKKVIHDIVALENSLDMYHLENKMYPSTDQGLEALVRKPSGAPEPRNYRDDGYIRRLPKDPWGNDYLLQNPGQFGKLDVFSAGADGVAGSDDDIGNWNISS